MLGAPLVVILYCFFICVSPFCGKDNNQTRRFLATSKCFLQLFFQTRKEFATLTRNLVDKEETRRFFFLAESLSYFGVEILMVLNADRAVARVKNIVRTFKTQEIAQYFFLIPCNVRRNRIVRFPSKDKKQDERS